MRFARRASHSGHPFSGARKGGKRATGVAVTRLKNNPPFPSLTVGGEGMESCSGAIRRDGFPTTRTAFVPSVLSIPNTHSRVVETPNTGALYSYTYCSPATVSRLGL